MHIPDDAVAAILVASGKLTAQGVAELRAKDSSKNHSLQDVAIADSIITEADLTKHYADKIGVSFAEIDPKTIKKELLNKIPDRIANRYKTVLFAVDPKGVALVAVGDPDDVQAQDFLQKTFGKAFKIYVVTRPNMAALLDLYRASMGSAISTAISSDGHDELGIEVPDEIREDDLAENSPIAQTVNLLLEYAIRSGASDVHIEPREHLVSVRYRIDGVLREVQQLPKKVLGALVSRIKIVASLKIDERRVPQDGRFKIDIEGRRYALRVSTLPITDGEKVVMRILDESNKAQTLEQLGFWGRSLEIVNRAISQPHGVVLVTGPTGSGKSTTLFSMLSLLNKPAVNISTIEDPVEYRIPGVNQTQVNPVAGMTFVNGLRALLRQDPNIIMVGEIRDSETADLAVQAALTGHMVFSTLHTNNAATCLPRLLDMKIEPFLIASTVRAVVGQRLVRKLCDDCRESYEPDIPTLSKIGNMFGIKDARALALLHALEAIAFDAGLGRDKDNRLPEVNELSTKGISIVRLYRAHDGGCNSCAHTGYKGRRGIYEVLSNTPAIQQMITSKDTSENIQAQAVKEGMITMQQDGLIKVLRGITSIDELLRVTSET